MPLALNWPFIIPNALADPTLELHNGTGALIASNDNWQTNNNRRHHHRQPGSALSKNSGHAPTHATGICDHRNLPPGNYTAIVRGANNTTGVALVEVYNLSPNAASILGNISTRGFVQTGDNVMIGGFIIEGTGPKTVILRAIGPELLRLRLTFLMRWLIRQWSCTMAAGALIARNDNWQTTIIGGIIAASQVQRYP